MSYNKMKFKNGTLSNRKIVETENR